MVFLFSSVSIYFRDIKVILIIFLNKSNLICMNLYSIYIMVATRDLLYLIFINKMFMQM